MKTIFYSALMALTLISLQAAAFPEMTRHGYTQCTSCHLSPVGGGILTSYGRELSEELLSTWSRKGEGRFLHGALKSDFSEKGLLFGGDVRSIQVHRKTSTVRSGRYFLMQANFDLAYQIERFAAMISIGQIEEPMSGRIQGNLFATKYYGLFNITDSWSLRAGRFAPTFGLNMADHILVTKQGLGLLPYAQYDTVETAFLSESWSLFASRGRTVEGTPSAQKENVTSAHATYNFAERYKVGASGWYGEGDNDIRRIYGINGILGFTHHFYNLTEIDLIHDSARDGIAAMTRFGYEIYKGIIPYVQYQHLKSDLESSNRATRYYTLGSHFFPRPHFELSGQWTKVRNVREWSDEAHLLVHYYF